MGWVSTCTQKCCWKNITVSEKQKKQLAKCIILWETHKPWISLDFKSVIKHPFKGDSPGHNLLVLFWLFFLFYFQWQRNPSEMSYEVIAGDCLPEKKKRIYVFSNFSMSLLLQNALVTFWNICKSNQFAEMIIYWKINDSTLMSLFSFLRSQILDTISGFRFHALLNSKQSS